jgi:hypothetical protein
VGELAREVERLKAINRGAVVCVGDAARQAEFLGDECYELGGKIARLAAERDRLAEALRKIATGDGVYGMQAHEYKQIARAALKEPLDA